MAALSETIAALKPDVSVLCGDITQNGSKDEFAAARAWIMSLPGRKIITAGNHDTPMFGLLHRIFQPFGRYKRQVKPLGAESYIDDHVAIMPYNTARGWQLKLDWSLGVVNLDHIKRVFNKLTATGKSTVKMIAVHHPLIYPPSSPLRKSTKNGAEALKLMSAENIDAVLSGHIHAPFVLDRQPDETEVMSIGAGTLSTRTRDRLASFNHILIDDHTITVTEIFWDKGKFMTAAPYIKPIAELKSRRG